MNKFSLIAALGLLAVCVLGLQWWISKGTGSAGHGPASGLHTPVVRHIHWELAVRNLGNEALRDVEVLSFLPVSTRWQQTLLEVSANYPLVKVDSPEQGIASLSLESIPPYGQRHVRIEAVVALYDSANGHDFSPSEASLAAEPLIESDHELIQILAEQLHRGRASSSRLIFDWLVAELEDLGYHPQDRGALHALRARGGDCSEFAALAVALARASGLPARMVNGFVVTENGRLGPHAFHAWAEIWEGDRWLILDAHQQRYDPPPQHYLATHHGTSQSRSLAWTRFDSPLSSVAIDMR